MSRFKQVKEYEQVGNIKLVELKNLLAICDHQAKLYQREMQDNKSMYEQLHRNVSLPTSMTMSLMTNSIYNSCDVWSSLNKMVAYSVRQESNLAEIAESHKTIKRVWNEGFKQIKKLDMIAMIQRAN